MRRIVPTTSLRCSKTIVRWMAAWAVLVLVLLSIDVSMATRNPLHHPQGTTTIDRNNNNVHVVRGGSTILQPPPPLQEDSAAAVAASSSSSTTTLSSRTLMEQAPTHYPQAPMAAATTNNQNNSNNNPMAFLPKIGLEQVSKALLHTSEWNKKLLRGIKHWGKHERIQLESSSSPPKPALTSTGTLSQQLPSNPHPNGNNYQQQHQQYQNYGSLPVNVHPSRTWQPPIEKDSGRSLEDEELTLFHAKTLVARSWGPQLLPYLKHIAEILEIPKSNSSSNNNSGIELVLAMIYLDRACSVETPRSNGIAHCPFLEPRTVHRLGLAALLVAKSATSQPARDNQQHFVSKLAVSLGIPQEQLEQMVEWMVGALGDDGLYVGLDELKAWSTVWEAFCDKTKL